MEECIYETYCGLCDVLMAYKTGHKSEFTSFWSETYKTGLKSEFTSFWSETTLESFLKARGVNYEKNDLNMKCHNFQDKVAIIGSDE